MLDIFAVSVKWQACNHLKRLILLHVIINISNIVTIINIVVINCVTCFHEQPSEIQYSLEKLPWNQIENKQWVPTIEKCIFCVRVPKGQ